MNKRVAVIGLDGMPWHILDKLFEYDTMPNLKKISERSLKGVLKSTLPPSTPPAWTSIASGVNPGKHGIFGFITLNENYETSLVTSKDVRYPRIHEMIVLKGLKTICVNQPLTYPIIEIGKNCHVLSDWLGPKLSFYPESLRKYAEHYPCYNPKILEKERDENLELLYTETEKRVETVNQMMQNLDWDLFWVMYSEPDGIFHKHYEEVLEGHERILRIFRKLDDTVETARETADLIFVVSDHGFAKYNFIFNINVFLEKLNLIAKSRERILGSFHDFGRFEEPIEYIPIPKSLYPLLAFKPIKLLIKSVHKRITGKGVRAKLLHVDPSRSKAFAMSQFNQGMYVNDEEAFKTILSELKQLKFITGIWRREEVYNGPYVKNAPDIVFTPDFDNGVDYSGGTTLLSSEILLRRLHYNHHPDGIIIMSGNEITPNQISNAKTFDVVPSILNYLGLPLPPDTDGAPLFGKACPKRYDYLKHWRLVRQVQLKKSKLALKS